MRIKCENSLKAIQWRCRLTSTTNPLRWRHNGRDSASNHQPHDCLFNRLFRRRSKKTSKLRVTGLCARNSPGTGEYPAQMVSNAENVSIWWRHHAQCKGKTILRLIYLYIGISYTRKMILHLHNAMLLNSPHWFGEQTECLIEIMSCNSDQRHG